MWGIKEIKGDKKSLTECYQDSFKKALAAWQLQSGAPTDSRMKSLALEPVEELQINPTNLDHKIQIGSTLNPKILK